MSQPPEAPAPAILRPAARRPIHLRDSQEAYRQEDSMRLSPGPSTGTRTTTARPSICLPLFGGREGLAQVGFGGELWSIRRAEPDGGSSAASPISDASAPCCCEDSGAQVWTNLRVHPGDARDLFRRAAEASIAQAFLRIPRPLAQEAAPPPPLRHARALLEPLARVLKPAPSPVGGRPDIRRTRPADAGRRCRAPGFECGRRAHDWREPWGD